MSFRKSHAALTSLANSLGRLVRPRQRKRIQAKRVARRQFLEHLEPRNLMALDIISMTPADGSVGWALNTNLTMKFNAAVVKGQGLINVVQNSTGTLGVAVDVNSPAVTIAGDTVTVDLPTDLLPATAYTVFIDSGTFLDTTTAPTAGATLLTQNFEFLPLQPFDAGIAGGDGTDYTLVPPLSDSVDNSSLPTGGLAPFRGWTFIDKNSWIAQAGNQDRTAFTLGTGTLAVGDTDQFDDAANGGGFNSKYVSRPISLAGVAANTVVLEFDSSFRPEGAQQATLPTTNQIGVLDVSFDNGTTWTNLTQYDVTNTDGAPTAPNVNAHKVFNIPNPASPAGAMKFRYGLTGTNDWWWALDNVKVSGTVTGTPFLGITDPTMWNLNLQTLTVGIDKSSMSENGGTATGTVTRLTSDKTAPLTVTLANSDTTEATIPATVTILAGEISATFPITAVDDTLADRAQTVSFTANAASYASGSASMTVLDDEGPDVVSLSSVGVDFRGNLSMIFNTAVVKGNGLINIVRTNGDLLVASIPVGSAAVTIAGNKVTINPPADLVNNTNYYVLVDDGAFVEAVSTTPSASAVKTLVQTTNFNLLPLGPFTAPATGGDGTDFTKTPPAGYSVTTLAGTSGGKADFNSWTFVDKGAWVATTGDGGRSGFARGEGVVAVADTAHWAGTGTMNTYLITRPIDLAASNIAAGSVSLEFDGLFATGIPTIGKVEVSYDNGNTYQIIGNIVGTSLNSHYVFNSAGATGGALDTFGLSPLNNQATGQMVFRIGLELSTGGVAAVDNIQVFAGVRAYTFEGISSKTAWTFTTTTAALSVSIDKTSISENGGTATGSVSRNVGSDVDITVLLTSDNTGKATVPTSVVIPKDTGVFTGPVSIPFTITAVDNALKDGGSTTVKVTATSVGPPTYVAGEATIVVTDDDYPKITTLSPADDSPAVPVGSNFVVTYSEDVKKGNGFVHIIRKSDGKSALDIDVQSAAVTISGAVVTINPPADLAGLTEYYISIDDGAILDNFTTVTRGTTLLTQDFELMTLGKAMVETVGLTPDGRDYTTTPPSGYSVDNSQMPPGGVPEWNGWSFADKSFWATQGGQSRSNFTRGQGTIAVGDTDEWDDLPTVNNSFNSFLKTTPISLANVVGGATPAEGTVVLEFDSSFRPEGSQSPTLPTDNQIGILDVSFDGGTTWSTLFQYDRTNTDGSAFAPNVNERKVVNVPNPAASPTGSMVFRFNVTGTNDWWWAIDNIKVTASTTGFASPGIANSDSTTWNFKTAEAATLSLGATPISIAENGGTSTVTVSRNLGTTGDLVVNLASSDPTVATVPATVTIPDGQASATFTVTAVDNTLAGGLKNVTVTAATAGFVSGTAGISVTDNEIVDVVVSEIMYVPNNGVKTEWIEVVNRGTVTADLGNWSFDDEDTTNWGKIPAGTLLAPGQVGVLYNNLVGTITDTNATRDTLFRTQWNVPTTAVVVGIFWGDLANSPSAVATLNENLMLKDAGNATIDQANYDDDLTNNWPANTAGASIYLKNIVNNNDFGINWALSTVGTDGAANALGPNYGTGDRGSPGTLPTPVAPKVQKVVFGDGTAQRSMVQSITVDFDTTVAILPNAFVLERKNGANWDSFTANELTLTPTLSSVNGNTRVTLTFSGSTVVGGSLADGNYRLTMISSNVTASGFNLDGDGNGTGGDNFIRGTVDTDNFFRLFGDFDGNRLINGLDLGRVRLANGTSSTDAAFNAIFDYNGDGVINGLDLGQIRIRNGTTLGF